MTAYHTSSAAYPVRRYGASGDGVTPDTAAIQQAIDRCHADGGGRVILDRGTFLSGTLYLKSNVFLEIEPAATLLASGNIDDYPDDTYYNRYRCETALNRCFIFAADAENIGLVGYGEINGNNEKFAAGLPGGDEPRPMLIRLLRCRNVRLENLRLHQAASWTVAFLDCDRLWCRGLDIFNDRHYNGDGLDFDNCSEVFVTDCSIRGTDDNLCLQNSRPDKPVRNVQISNCHFSSLCAAIRIGYRSAGEISNVVIANCTFENVWREGIKIECSEGGVIRDITAGNLTMRNVTRPLFLLLNNSRVMQAYRPPGGAIPAIGRLEDLKFNNILIHDDDEMLAEHRRFGGELMGSPRFNGIRADAAAEHPIDGLAVSNLSYRVIGGVKSTDLPKEYPSVLDQRDSYPPDVPVVENNYAPAWSRAAAVDLRNVRHLSLDQVQIQLRYPDERPPVILENCQLLRHDIRLPD
ncbi:glycoside hydrolase family 28 protein [Victivallis sp. Marseille-Q1083]|uniref:glycoside hydrolase family 28 protein n=1 Tax=Victivallis sp. Marseille-Q1083 TaxID=2717288 RepID=UPI00158C265B|nr:glycosyl hydrolase family 28 protein [Victivallis sp. Marseille-Q1083]